MDTREGRRYGRALRRKGEEMDDSPTLIGKLCDEAIEAVREKAVACGREVIHVAMFVCLEPTDDSDTNGGMVSFGYENDEAIISDTLGHLQHVAALSGMGIMVAAIDVLDLGDIIDGPNLGPVI